VKIWTIVRATGKIDNLRGMISSAVINNFFDGQT
jgi:hypothetical protein